MDRHDLPNHITAKDIAKMHQEDLKIEHKFNCRGLTYWCDEERGTAFCLIEAPNRGAIEAMHNHAHGAVAHSIIEVEDKIVASFLGRIEDPVKAKNVELNIINEPAFRTIVVIKVKKMNLNNHDSKKHQNLQKSILTIMRNFKGRVVKQQSGYFLTSFESVTKAVLCALEIQSKTKQLICNPPSHIKINIGISAGIPVTERGGIFEDTIKLAQRLCNIVKGNIVLSSEVKDLYESENLNSFINEKTSSLNSSEEKFLTTFMNYTENKWNFNNLKIDSFSTELGYSKSQLYRKITTLTGKSPNIFIKEYRLNQALKLLKKQTNSISEIAFKTGFNTPAYFSKCFFETYGILPSNYIKEKL